MKVAHLSQDELLLLCDGELSAERRAHHEQCPQCAAAFTEWNAVLGMACEELQAAVPAETAGTHAASRARLWRRLHEPAARVVEAHVGEPDLVLYLDGELEPGRAAHIGQCEVCSVRSEQIEAVLAAAELELQAAIPAETAAERAASWARLQQALTPARVFEFPLRRALPYAAAAAMAFATLGGYLWQQGNQGNPVAEAPPPAATAEAPLPQPDEMLVAEVAPVATPERTFRAGGGREELAAATAPAPQTAPAMERSRLESRERFSPLLSLERMTAPARTALVPVASPAERGFSAPALMVSPGSQGWFAPPLPDIAVAQPAPRAVSPARRAAGMIEGYRLLVQAGLWREDLRPVVTEEGLRFSGSAENDASKQRMMAALRSAAGATAVQFDLQVREQAQARFTPVSAPRQAQAANPGGMVRTALLAHYSDAARRSFQTPTPALLESEIARYVNQVFRSQSELLAHSYGLREVVASLRPVSLESLDAESRGRLAELLRFHLAGVIREERRIYDNLSEALPRKLWTYRQGESSLKEGSDWRSEGEALLAESLELERRLTRMLSAAAIVVDVSEREVPVGELLYRIRSRAERLEASAKTLPQGL